eukprot:366277-Chlamydomonas_euryale.AAC.6
MVWFTAHSSFNLARHLCTDQRSDCARRQSGGLAAARRDAGDPTQVRGPNVPHVCCMGVTPGLNVLVPSMLGQLSLSWTLPLYTHT